MTLKQIQRKKATSGERCLVPFQIQNYTIYAVDQYMNYVNPPIADIMKRKTYMCGVLSIGFGVYDQEFRHYSGGIYNTTTICNRKYNYPNHAMAIVGYGVEKKVPYW